MQCNVIQCKRGSHDVPPLAEVPCFRASGRVIGRLGTHGALALAAAAYVVRFAWYSALATPWLVLPAEVPCDVM